MWWYTFGYKKIKLEYINIMNSLLLNRRWKSIILESFKDISPKGIHGGVFSINFLILIVVLKRITFISNGLELDEKNGAKKKGFLLFCKRIYGFLGCGHLLSVLLTVCRYLTHNIFISTQKCLCSSPFHIILSTLKKIVKICPMNSFWRQWRTLYAA